MFKGIQEKANRTFRIIDKVWDYLLVSTLNPKLFVFATKHLTREKFRSIHGALRLKKNSCVLRAQASHNNVTANQLLNFAGKRVGILLLRASPSSEIVIGVRDIDFLSVIWLMHDFCPSGIVLAGDKTVETQKPGWWRSHDVAEVSFLLPEGGRIKLERYKKQGPRLWVSNNRMNPDARVLYNDLLERPGLYPLSVVLPAPTLERKLLAEDVDVVYSWVNHQDLDWAATFNQHRSLLSTDSNARGVNDSFSLTRFHSMNELRYSLRTIARNMPWARRIHILTNCAPPEWINPHHDKINWIDHGDVIAPNYLPTFSSHVIESYLHHIPDLTNRFVYLNDDFFVVSPKQKTFFFGCTGNSRAFLEPDGVVSGPRRGIDPDYLNASRNSASLLLRDFGFWPTQLHKHSAYALSRAVLEEIEQRWADDFSAFRRNKFRGINDLNLTSFLYHHYALATGRAEIADVKLSVVMSFDVRWRNKLKNALSYDTEMLCINEGGAVSPSVHWHSAVQEFLQSNFPWIAPWEI